MSADSMPSWVIPGIAAVETGSFLKPDGRTWHWTDRNPGTSGELGIWQMMPAAFEIASTGRGHAKFSDLLIPEIAERMATRYLVYLRRNTASWDQAVMAYHTGLSGLRKHEVRGKAYLVRVRQAGGAPTNPTKDTP